MRLSRSARWLLLALLLSVIPASSYAGVFISVGFAPPVLPVYVQPVCPQPGLMWTPGYWAYGEDGYFWVPGAWVPVPYEGALWTPGYWGWSGGMFIFHDGYWGRHVGYYGGVNYGFGYGGIGFFGGEWRGHEFAYNTAVMHVNQTVIHNTYINETVVRQNTIVNNNHVAYSGGPGGIQHQPSPEERAAEREPHVQPTSVQQHHIQAAQTDKSSYVKNNGGHPQTLAVARPLQAEHQSAPIAHPQPVGHPMQQPAGRQNPQTAGRQEQYSSPMQQHSAPQSHAAPVQQRPMPASRPAAAQPRSAPQAARPAPAPRPAPQARPAPASRPAPREKGK